MQQVTAAALGALREQQPIGLALEVGTTARPVGELISVKYLAGVNESGSFLLGRAAAAQAEVLVEGVGLSLAGASACLRWRCGGESYPLLTGEITEVEELGDRTKVFLHDRLYVFGGKRYEMGEDTAGSCTLEAVLREIAEELGVSLAQETAERAAGIALTEGASPLGETTLQAAAGSAAALLGGNAAIDRAGALVVCGFAEAAFSGECYADSAEREALFTVTGLTMERIITVTGTEGEYPTKTTETVTCTAGEETGAVLTLQNNLATQSLTEGALAELNGLSFYPGRYELPGGIQLEPGDVVTLDGSTVAVAGVSMTLDGGCRCTVTSLGRSESGSSNVDSALSAVTAAVQEVQYLAAETAKLTHANIESLRAEMVTAEALNAVRADIDTLNAQTAELQTAVIDRASVGDLEAANAEIEQLKSADAEIRNAILDKAEIGDLEATNASLETVAADVANISTLLAGSVGAGNLQTIHLTGANMVIEDAVITDAMIAGLSAGKINAGTLYTNLVRIASQSGNLSIADNTIQIRDGSGTLRVQIGEDAAGDYSYYLWDADGTLLWQPTGITGEGIGSGTIKDVNVAEDAAISGSKLDITSVAEKLNEDGSIVVDGSRVNLDGTTLDVAYQTIIQKTDGNTDALDALKGDSVADVTPYYIVGTSPDAPPSEPGSTGTGRAAALVGTAVVGESLVGDAVGGTGEWTTEQPTAGDGQYLWVSYRVEYLDGTVKWTDPALLTDADLREKTTTLQTELAVVQGKIESKVWQTEIDEAQAQLQTQLSDMGTSITQTTEEIVSEATKNMVTQDEFALYQETVSSSFSQQADRFDLQITQAVGAIQDQTDANTEALETVTHSIRFTADGNVDLSAVNVRFVDNAGEPVSYWDGNTLHTGNIYVDTSERARFGNFAFQPRSDGSLVFLKVGG